MIAWAQQVRKARRPVLVFAQELSSSWMESWCDEYQTFVGCERGWKTRSVLLVRRDLAASRLSADD